MFTNKDLRNLIVPLFIEQFLLMFVGIADTFVVSFSSEADVSGVSLVTSFNTVLIFLFTALSSGGVVIISQYIGSKNENSASRSSGQLLMISTVISVAMTIPIILFREPLLRLLFGKIEQDVMSACDIYLLITTLSLPALAIYDAGASLCRSIGRTNVTMYISIVANVINVIGNCVGVFLLHLGAAGVAYPSLISRILSAVAVTVFCFNKKNPVRYKAADIFSWDGMLLKKNHGHRASQWGREWRSSAGKGRTFQHGRAFWYIPDRSERRRPEYLVACFDHGTCHVSGLHNGYRSVHGCERY